MVEYLDRKYYQPRKLQMRACHPRDLIEQVVDMCRYQEREPVITRELLDAACGSYFLEETESQGTGAIETRCPDSSTSARASPSTTAPTARSTPNGWPTSPRAPPSSCLFSLMAIRFGADFLATGRVTGLLLLVSEALVVALTVLRRSAGARRSQPRARLLTALSMLGPPLLRPGTSRRSRRSR